MIWLNQAKDPLFNVNTEFLLEYKKECDRYLGGAKHIMTQQLLEYTVYSDLQKLYNSFGAFLRSLLNETLTDQKEYEKMKKDIEVKTDAFLQGLDGTLPENVTQAIVEQINMFTTKMQKFYYVLETLCYAGGNK